MNILIAKLGATGDVVRTTPLLRRLSGNITWLTAVKNTVLLAGLRNNLRCCSWEERGSVLDTHFDLVINLEDTLEVAQFLKGVPCNETFGACLDSNGALQYTENSSRWFDLSLISSYGREEADRRKLLNRRTYQDMIFQGLGFQFASERYLLPEPMETGLTGDVAIAPEAGIVWPMKNWAYYNELKQQLEDLGLVVNVLPVRSSLLEHLADVRNHRCLVGGDSLPMHLALGTGRRCVSLFNCTSPWEIHDYGIQQKIVSPLLEEFFYKRGYDCRATTAINVGEVFNAVMSQLEKTASLTNHASVK
jgi:lipopolysaccharide heptosyltransferase II